MPKKFKKRTQKSKIQNKDINSGASPKSNKNTNTNRCRTSHKSPPSRTETESTSLREDRPSQPTTTEPSPTVESSTPQSRGTSHSSSSWASVRSSSAGISPSPPCPRVRRSRFSALLPSLTGPEAPEGSFHPTLTSILRSSFSDSTKLSLEF